MEPSLRTSKESKIHANQFMKPQSGGCEKFRMTSLATSLNVRLPVRESKPHAVKRERERLRACRTNNTLVFGYDQPRKPHGASSLGNLHFSLRDTVLLSRSRACQETTRTIAWDHRGLRHLSPILWHPESVHPCRTNKSKSCLLCVENGSTFASPRREKPPETNKYSEKQLLPAISSSKPITLPADCKLTLYLDIA